ncbi:MAG: homoserine dehydrogenase, partial [Casimicrobiaceae bacterium]
MRPLQVGLLGFGIVGRGTWEVLRRNGEEIARRAGRPIRIAWIATRSPAKAGNALNGANGVRLTANASEVVRNPDIDIVCELIGGIEPARSLMLEAIAGGKHVVTANKALLAQHGTE